MHLDPVQGIEREPTDAERAEFNRLYPSMAFSRTASEGGKMETPWVKLCLKLIRKIQKEKMAPPFKEPVDYVKLNIPDYPTIIKHPMVRTDFGGCQDRATMSAPSIAHSLPSLRLWWFVPGPRHD